MSAAEFYAARDQRTDLCAPSPSYQQARCGLAVSERLAETFEGQVMAIAAGNLLSRWCRDVQLDVPATPLLPELRLGEWTTLRDRILGEMHGADPFGMFEPAGQLGNDRIVLRIGEGAGTWFIDADAWRAATSGERLAGSLAKGGCVPVGALVAACLGIARSFKAACRMQQDSRLWRFDSFNLRADFERSPGPARPEAAKLGRILLVGGGAVGSGMLYGARLTNLRGHWIIVDHDTVKIHNLNRSPLLMTAHVGRQKAEVCASYLAGSPHTAEFHALEIGAYLEQQERAPNGWDLVLPEANEHAARWKIQNQVPPLMIHGTTGHDWDVTIARHIPRRDACLVCRFPNDAGQPALACGTGEVPDENAGEAHAALPFISTLSSTLALAELLKLHLPAYPFTSNAAYLQIKEADLFLSNSMMRLVPGCLCSAQSGLFERYNGRTRFAELTRGA